MKKLLTILLVLSILFCGCDAEKPKEQKEPVPGISNTEELESIPEETSKTEPEEEITQNEENDELAYIREFLEDLGIDKNAEELVISGTGGTKHIELVENFVASVEKNEAATVMGVMYGYTMPYYFELSYEPGGVIELFQYSLNGSFSGEIIRVYDTDSFYFFAGRRGIGFSILKHTLFYDEKHECSKEEISNMPVTPEQAKEAARKILLVGNGYSNYLSEINAEKPIGSYGSVIPDDYSDKAEEYYISLVPKYEGTFMIDGKPHHLIRFHESGNDTDIGFYYYVFAEDKNTVFSVSEVDGSLRPISYIPEPRMIFKR